MCRFRSYFLGIMRLGQEEGSPFRGMRIPCRGFQIFPTKTLEDPSFHDVPFAFQLDSP